MSVLKACFCLAVPVVLLGIGLGHTTPDDRSLYLSVIRRALGADAPASRFASLSSGNPPGAQSVRPSQIAWSTVIDPDRFGQFQTRIEINGRELDALVDTGASFVSLSFEDAASVGIHPSASDFRFTMQTANGPARVASAILPHVRVGNIEAGNVQAVISESGALTTHNLLGMSFLRKLSGFQFDSGRLVLKQ